MISVTCSEFFVYIDLDFPLGSPGNFKKYGVEFVSLWCGRILDLDGTIIVNYRVYRKETFRFRF
jgi:hypothetical protein